ncbi:hypothetical protein IWW37_001517 [Coemansia sp. RSA 2050]|nr:hypothetical protein IWW37_001517 [Coemansia sp. RSA 2050]KAJ2734800.1 hypothetical protein IW152_002018 [Coemansia sp. BCRC 34962]
MRFFAILAVLSGLLGLCLAVTRQVVLINEKGQKESYDWDGCFRVSRKFSTGKVILSSTGGKVTYFKDSKCKEIAFDADIGQGTIFTSQFPIKSFRPKWD